MLGKREAPPELEKLRHLMVKQQIEGAGIRDPRVLEAMRKVPRHLFVEEALASRAYTDSPLPIGNRQTISCHSFHARGR